MEITFFTFFMLSLAVFRITRLIVYDTITHFIRDPFFREYEEISHSGEKEVYIAPREDGIRGWIGELLNCYWCTGIWVSIGVYCLYQFYPMIGMYIIYIFSIAGLAALIETLQNKFLD